MTGRTARKNFRLTEREAELLAERAARSGVSETEYVCSLIVDPAHVFIADDGELRRLHRELKREGTNLNQIARIYNSRRDTASELIALKGCLAHLHRVLSELEDVLSTIRKRRR